MGSRVAVRSAAVAVIVPVTGALGTAHIAGAQPAYAAYSSPALGTFVAEVARDNRVPPELAGYTAAVESEIGIALRREGGGEALVGVEQIASTLRWARSGAYEQRVVGYRAQQAVPTASMLAMLRTGWVVPVLYGERLVPPRPPGPDSSRGGRRRARRSETPTVVVHPFAADRDRYYAFTGGDTVVTLRIPDGSGGTRRIPVVRVHVEPRADLSLGAEPGGAERAGLFLGDVDVDAERHVIVRMRGRYLVASSRPPGLRGRLARSALQGFAFVEYETAERGGRYWLPAYQRIELQAVSVVTGESRAVLRIVSRVRDVVTDTARTLSPGTVLSSGSAARPRWRLTRAPSDTLARFDRWNAALGALSGAVHADDFDDVAPDAWRAVGPPRAEPYAARLSDLVRFNRVEGLYTGVGARVRFRDAAPGLTLRATGGWAWAESTARGRVELEQALGAHNANSVATSDSAPTARWFMGLRAARSLDLTNDFRSPLDSADSFGALFFSTDAYDYVDRRLATAVVRRVSAARGTALRVEVGAASDRPVTRHVRRGLFGDTTFTANRGVDAGRYLRTAVTAELRPDVAAEFVRPGIGARLFYERGDGGLDFQHVEARVVGRVPLSVRWPAPLGGSTLTAVARADVGAVFAGEPPPQQLFELGGSLSLRGYDYKTFAGDRAGLGRVTLLYGSPWLRAPIRLGAMMLPGLSPGLSTTLEGGWSAASSDGARRSIARLGLQPVPDSTLLASWVPVPLSRPSAGLRATLDVGLRFFGGALFVGVARPVDRQHDRSSAWRGVVGFGG